MMPGATGVMAKGKAKDDPTLWKQNHRKAVVTTKAALQHNPRFDSYKKYKGVDVSVYDGGDIDWKNVKNSGIKFAIVRVGARGYGASGTFIQDSYYKANMTNAAKQGLKVGAYMFSQATTVKEAKDEADYILTRIKPYKAKINMPVVFDYEYSGGSAGRLTKAKLSKSKKREIADAFCAKVKKAGYTPMLYANTSFLNNDINMKGFKYPVWVAQYNYKCNYTGTYEMWQYSSTQEVPGISPQNEDVNYWYTKDINKYSQKPSKPDFKGTTVVKTGNVSKDSISISWAKTKDADSYFVERINVNDSKDKKSEKVKETTYKDEGLKEDTEYSYVVTPYKGNDRGTPSAALKIRTAKAEAVPTALAAPNIKISRAGDIVKFSWNKVPNADYYQVTYVTDRGEKSFATEGTSYSVNLLGKDAAYVKVRAASRDEERYKESQEKTSKMGYIPFRYTIKDSKGNKMAYKFNGKYYTAKDKFQIGKVKTTAKNIAKNGVKLRAGRSTSSKQIGLVKYNKTVEVLKTYSGKYRNWLKVKCGKKTGFVWGAYFR